MKTHKIYVLSLALFVTFIITGCGGGGDSAAGDAGTPEETIIPTKLSFVVHPSTEEIMDAPFSFMSIEVLDQNGKRDVTYSGEVQVTLTTGSGNLLGTMLRTISEGAAYFDDLSYDQQETISIALSSTGLVGEDATIIVRPVDYIAGGLPIERVSVSSTGIEANGSSGNSTSTTEGGAPVLSRNGRYVAFVSLASNLIDSDTNGLRDVFVHDRSSGVTERVSFDIGNTQSSFDSYDPTISENGRFVIFRGDYQLYVFDRDVKETLSLPSTVNVYAQSSLSANNRYVSVRNHFMDMFDLSQTLAVHAADGTPGNNTSGEDDLVLSSTGRFIAFESNSSNLVPDDTNGMPDIFVYDRDVDKDGIFDEDGDTKTVRVSISSSGVQSNSGSEEPEISDDGRFITFQSWSTNLIDGVSVTGWLHIYVHDRDSDNDGIYDEPGAIETKLATTSTAGDIAVGASWGPAISGDGRYVTYVSYANNLIGGTNYGANHIYVHDNITGETEIVSTTSNGAEANDDSDAPSISSDGRYIGFQSSATNLVSGDTNGWVDAFVAPNPLY